MNGTAQQGFGYRARRTFTRLLVFTLILGLGGVVVFLLSQLNARTFTLALQDGQLVVMKGRNAPMGALPYRTGDPRLADAYAPIAVEGQDVSSLLTRKFTDRDELDQALFPVLESLARPRIASDEPARVDQGLYYLRRAEKLSGITEEQRLTLQKHMVDVAYYQARQKLEDARRLVSEALTQLKLAAESQSRNARSANQMLSAVAPPARDLEDALRRAVHSLSGPQAAPQAPPQAAPQPAPSSPPPAPEPQPQTTGEALDEAPQAPTGTDAGGVVPTPP
ncbi:IF-2 protein [Corallococcus macrosporus]|uniref:IF-2 protein n=1 Tax=Corallococcus macrosporus DSM 14697 TaxID=1189310 RepID=A0A250K0M6_9BACT|nr:IF-2 protein [Corallococcus macrosporus]ATB49287.1 IF-2 protein [Corallococcus macrosporus DSM 14697]